MLIPTYPGKPGRIRKKKTIDSEIYRFYVIKLKIKKISEWPP